jgi:GR25 family glycosyltransferase involved in LPS biosynthesis
MIDAYVINLDRQIENYSKVEDAMNDLGGFNVQRVSAIDGKRGDHLTLVDSETTWLCKETCPDSIIAIALSHKKVAQMILDSGVDYALVLEDDAIPIKDGFHEKLQRTLAEIPDDWDIINLYYGGIYNDDDIYTSYLTGSTAAILVSKSGAKKIIDLKIKTHIDMQTNFGFKKYKSRDHLFITDETSSTNSSNTTTLSAKMKSYISVRERILKFNYIKLFGFTWILDDLLNFLIYLIGFLLILFLKL